MGDYIDVSMDAPPEQNADDDYVGEEPIVAALQEIEDAGEAPDEPKDDEPVVKGLHEIFTLEASDPKHRRGDYLWVLRKSYAKEQHFGTGDFEFLRWVDRITVVEFRKAMLDYATSAQNDEMIKKFSAPLGAVSEVLQAFQAGVKYKGDRAGLSSARKYRIVFESGLIKRTGRIDNGKWVNTNIIEPYSTTGNHSHWNGNDWGIWVQGLDGTFYANRMRVGRFQHSSFLSGNTVRAAGEWTVINGRLTHISARSGHYRPTFKQLMQALRNLKGHDLQRFDEVMVVVYDAWNITHPKVEVSTKELLDMSDDQASGRYKVDPSA